MVKPAEIGNIEFSTSFRGYNPDQVDNYVDNVVKYYTETYNSCIELNKLCSEQKKLIAELEAKLGERRAEPVSKDEKVALYDDSAKTEYEEYKNQAEQLREAMISYKAEIFSMYQKQIEELKKFDTDGLTVPAEPEDLPAIEDEITIPKIDETPIAESAIEKDSEIDALVSDLDTFGSSDESYNNNADVSSLVNDLSEILGTNDPEEKKPENINTVKQETKTVDADYTNAFNKMFITDIG